MEWRTASSNSIGPGMSNVGCSGWFDILGVGEELKGLIWVAGNEMPRDLSTEYEVLGGSGGLRSRCLEIKESLSCGATMEIAGYNRRRRATVTSRSRYHPIGQCGAGLAGGRGSEELTRVDRGEIYNDAFSCNRRCFCTSIGILIVKKYFAL